MRFVLTLIADPARRDLDAGHLEAAAGALAGAGATPGAADWLAPGLACDLPFDASDPARARSAAGEALAGAPFDLAVQPAAGRRKAMLVADMESTIIAEEMLDELADGLGLRGHIAAITAETMAGALDFTAALRARVALLEGLPMAALDEAADRMTVNPGARALVATMNAAGAHTLLATGGFDVFAGRVATLCGFQTWQANRLEIRDGCLTGAVLDPVLDQRAKLDALRRAARDLGVEPAAACAVGDGANDVDMLSAAGLGVAYRGKPLARAAADATVDHGDFTALLYLQGFRESEIKSG